jgi:hypothetical protein
MWWDQAKRIIHVHVDGVEDVLNRHEYEALYERLILAFAEDDDDEVQCALLGLLILGLQVGLRVACFKFICL